MLSRRITRSYVLLATAILSMLPSVLADETNQPGWETIRPDYSNVRGLNYIASYAPSDVAMWRHYDRQQIDRELAMIKGMGVNSIRVWLAWVVYDVEGEKFIDKFSDFLSLCEKHRIAVMPILWDSCFGDEAASYDDVQDWVANPGTKRVADPAFRDSGDAYVRAVVRAGSTSPSLLLWDVMNEPSGSKVNEWLEHYCRLVKQLDPKHPVTIGWAAAASNEISADWVDVMSYHPYGIFDKNREIWTSQVRKIAKAHRSKPILVTEAGGPGLGQRYEECIASFEKLGVGFYLFEAMVGTNRFRNITGFFFPDGSPRETEPIDAFQALARRQSVNPAGKYTTPTQQPPYEVAGMADVAELIRNWDQEKLTAVNYARREPLLTWTFISLAWGGALKDHIGHVQDLKRQVDEAVKQGDLEKVRKLTSELAALAAKLLVENGFVQHQ